MAAFNLTAEINLRGPSNLNQVVGNIRRQLSTVSLNLNINQNTSTAIRGLTGDVRNLSVALRDAQTNAAALANAINNIGAGGGGGGNINNITNTINAGLNQVNNQARNTQNAIGGARSEMEEFGRQSALAIRRFAAFSVATGAVYTFINAISSAYSEFLNFNKEFVRLQQVTESSATSLKPLADEITRLSTSLGVTSNDLLGVSTTLAQAGLSANDTKIALEALAKSALAPSFDDLGSTVEGSIAILRQFGLGANDLESALGSINAVAARFAVEASDIITAVQRTGGVFAAASRGVSEGKDALNEFVAVFTSVRATTRESAETIATGLRTIFTRIQRGATIEALKAFGIELTDLEGKFVGPFEAVKRLSEGLKGLDPRDLRFSQIVEELGGFRQIGKVIPLIQQFATAQQALGVAQRGAGSLTSDAARAQEALAVKITKVREEFIALIRDIGQSKSFQTFADVSLQLASGLISVASAAKEALPALAAILALRGIGSLGQFVTGFAGGIGARGGRRFASGGLVPGSGNRDTVSAMLTPGEFVIRKKAVQAIGTNNLHRINKYAKGGIVVDPNKIGAFFLQPPNAPDRKPIPVKGSGNIKNYLALKELGVEPGAADARKQALAQSRKTSQTGSSIRTQAMMLGLLPTGLGKDAENQFLKNKKLIDTSKLIDKQGQIIKTRDARQVLFQAGYSREDIEAFDPKRATRKITGGIERGKLSVSAQAIPISGSISAYFPGKDDLQRSPVARQISRNTKNGLYNTVMKSIEPIITSLNNPNISVNANQAKSGASRIANDENARKTTEGFIFEGIIQAITGAQLAGNQSYFDFQNVSANRESLSNLFTDSSGEGIGSLEKADAKRSASGSALTNLISKVINEINRGDFRGVTFNKFAQGGNVDTVPALLTPGEFVINKKAASRIGMNRLNQLNKADKVSGFNTGGSVGHIQEFANGGGVQKFFVGGIVTAFGRLLPVIARLTSSLTGLGRVAATASRGGGLIPAGAAGTRLMQNARAARAAGYTRDAFRMQMGGAPRAARAAAQTPRNAQNGPGLLELSGLLFAFQGLTSFINGPLGGALTNFASVATLTFAAIPGPLPFKLLVSAITGGIAAFKGWNDALKEEQIARQQTVLQNTSSRLDTSFEKLSDATERQQDTKPIVQDILNDIKTAAEAESYLRKQTNKAAAVTNYGRAAEFITRGTFNYDAKVDTKALSLELAGIGKVSAANIQKYINDALTRGLSLEDITQQLDALGPDAVQSIKKSFAVAEGGTAVTDKMAEIQAMRSEGLDTSTQEKEFQDLIDKTWSEFVNAANEQAQAQKKNTDAQKASEQAALEAANAINIFREAMKNVASAVDRAGAEFAKANRLIDINLGSAFGDTLSIQRQPDRMNENVLSNLRAYTNNEISATIGRLSDNLGFDPKFTDKLSQTALSLKALESSLPQILSKAAALQGAGGFQANEQAIADEIKAALAGLGGDTDTIAADIMKAIQDKRISTQETSLKEIANSSQILQKILEGYSDQVKVAEETQKAYNDMLMEVNGRMNQYVDSLGRATDYQIKASDIRLNAEVQLREALNEQVSLFDMNKAFDTAIATLTTVTAPNGQQLGPTDDPVEIARRQNMLESEQARLQKRRDQFGVGTDKWKELNASLVRTTNEARNLSKAQEKLASDTTRASNAMSKIQAITQAREGARNQLFDLFKNINNPEWVQSFVNSVGSYTRVLSGSGTIQDLEPAINALEKRLQTLTGPEQLQAREDFAKQAADIVARATGAGPAEAAAIAKQLMEVGGFGKNPELDAAIGDFRDATEKAATANERMAKRTEEAGDKFFEQVKQAADAWIKRVGAAGNLDVGGNVNVKGAVNAAGGVNGGGRQQPPPQQAGGKQYGGMVYASNGKLIDFKPKGTDTVPAMLTPGEFVVNKDATQKNLPLLEQINSGSQAYSSGGVVYARTGGQILDDLRSVNSSLQLNQNLVQYKFDAQDAIKQADEFNKLLSELANKIKETRGAKDNDLWSSLTGAALNDLPYWAKRDVSKMKFSEFLKWKDNHDNFIRAAGFSPLITVMDNNNGFASRAEASTFVPPAQGKPPTTPQEEEEYKRYKLFRSSNAGAKPGSAVAKAASSFREYLKYMYGEDLKGIDPTKFEDDRDIPVVAEAANRPPAPDYYDELTYKEYLDKIIRQGFAPEPPERARFTTDAFYTKSKIGTVETEEDVLDRLYGQYGDAYEQHSRNMREKVFPEMAIRNPGLKQALINGGKSFKDFLKSRESLSLYGFDINDISMKPQENSTTTRARVTQFDTRLVGPINGGPLGDIDINQVKQTATLLQEKAAAAVQSANAYAALATTGIDQDAINAALANVSKNYEEAVSVLDQLSNLTILRKQGKIHIPNNNDQDINIRNIVDQLRNVRLTYSKPENIFRSADFSDATLAAFDAKYAQIMTQNMPAADTERVPGRTTVAGMTDTQRKNIWGRKSALSQYRDSVAHYQVQRGKYNYNQKLKANRNRFLDSRVGRFQTGGIVYSSQGSMIGFQPRGTDTVPAMLTPGEFVVNAKATKQNLGLLQNINNGAKGYNRGGVAYLAKGGINTGTTSLGNTSTKPSIITSGGSSITTNSLDQEKLAQQRAELQAELDRISGSRKENAAPIAQAIALLDSVIDESGKNIGDIFEGVSDTAPLPTSLTPARLNEYTAKTKELDKLKSERDRLQQKLALTLLGENNPSWLTRTELFAKQAAEIGVGFGGGAVGSTLMAPTAAVTGPVGPVAGAGLGYAAAVTAYKDLLGSEYADRLDALKMLYPGQSLATDLAPIALAIGNAKNIVSSLRTKGAASLAKPMAQEVAGDLAGSLAAAATIDEQFAPGIQDVILSSLGINVPKGTKLYGALGGKDPSRAPRNTRLGYEELPGLGSRRSPGFGGSTSGENVGLLSPQEPTGYIDMPGAGGNIDRSVSQATTVAEYRANLTKFRDEQIKIIKEYQLSRRDKLIEDIKRQRQNDPNNVYNRGYTRDTPEEAADKSISSAIRSQTAQLEAEYAEAIRRSEFDFKTGRLAETRPNTNRILVNRANPSNIQWKRNVDPKDPHMRGSMMLSGYDSSVFTSLIDKLIMLSGPSGELPATLSSSNFLLRDGSIDITGIGTQPPFESTMGGTLRRVSMFDENGMYQLKSAITSDLYQLINNLRAVEQPTDEFKQSDRGFGLEQQKIGGQYGVSVGGTGQFFRTESDNLALEILKHTNFPLTEADFDPALRDSKLGFHINTAREFLQAEQQRITAQLETTLKNKKIGASSRLDRPRGLNKPTPPVRIVDPYSAPPGSNNDGPSKVISAYGEIAAIYDDPELGGAQAWGRVSAVPDAQMVLAEEAKHYKIQTSLTKEGYGAKLYEALLEYMYDNGKWIRPDNPNQVSPEAQSVWQKYVSRSDIEKQKIDPNGGDNWWNFYYRKPTGSQSIPRLEGETRRPSRVPENLPQQQQSTAEQVFGDIGEQARNNRDRAFGNLGSQMIASSAATPGSVLSKDSLLSQLRDRLKLSGPPDVSVFQDTYTKVARLIAQNKGFDVVDLSTKLDETVTRNGTNVTLAMLSKILGLPLDYIIPPNMVLEFVKGMASQQHTLGTWNEASKLMTLAIPENIAAEGASNRVVMHEAGHSVVRRFGESGYDRFQEIMANSRETISRYMQDRPDLFGSYTKSTVDTGLQYILSRVLTKTEKRPVSNAAGEQLSVATKWGNLGKLLIGEQALPLDANQQEIIKRFQDEMRLFQEKKTPTPPLPKFLSFPGLPPISAGDILPNGKIHPLSATAENGKKIFFSMRDIVDAADTGDIANMEQVYNDFFGTNGPPVPYKTLLDISREEFVTQMLQNFDLLDQAGLQILTELLDGTISNSSLFDPVKFYERARVLLNERLAEEGSLYETGAARDIGEMKPFQRGASLTKPPRIGPPARASKPPVPPPPPPPSRGGPPPLPPQRRQHGGLIYAQNGSLVDFSPKGTDTVPAMLTPGEFVVNARATKNNMGLLQAINSGAKPYKKGGIVYAADGGPVGSPAIEDIDWASIDSLNNQLQAFASSKEKAAKKHRQDPNAGPHPIIKQLSSTLKKLNITNAPPALVAQLNSLHNIRPDQVAALSSDTFIKFIQGINTTIGMAKKDYETRKAKVAAKPPALVGPADPAAAAGALPMPDPKAAPMPDPKAAPQPTPASALDPDYYDELTYKEYLWKTIKDSWSKIKSNQPFSGPVPPDQARFITPAFYYKKDAENQIDVGQKEKIEKAKVMAEEWKKEYEQWRQDTEKRKAEVEKAGRKYEPTDPRENQWLDDMVLWAQQYPAIEGMTPEEIKKVFVDAKMSTNPRFSARATAFDVRNTSGIVGGGEKIDPKDVDQERVKALSTGLLTEITNAEKLLGEYKAEATNQATKPEDLKRSKEIFGTSYQDAVKLLQDLSKEQTLYSGGGASFTTAEGAGTRTYGISTAVSRLKTLRNSYRSDIIEPGILPGGFVDSILDEFKVAPEQANTAGARDKAPKPAYAPIVRQTPPDPKQFEQKPVAGKTIVAGMSDQEKKSITGRKGTLTQYRDSVARYQVERGKFNYEYKLYLNRQAALDARQGRMRAAGLALASGGLVYAQNGTLVNFQPRGTDTVPAMLTPGEFVINRKATKNNLPLLKAINDNKTPYFANGGIVQRFQNGGMAEMSGGANGGVSNISLDTSGLDSSFSKFAQYVEGLKSVVDSFISGGQTLTGAINSLNGITTASQGLSAAASVLRGSTEGLSNSIVGFNAAVQSFERAISTIPSTIGLQVSGSIPVTVSVEVNGGEGLSQNLKQFQQTIYSDITKALNEATSGKLKINLTVS